MKRSSFSKIVLSAVLIVPSLHAQTKPDPAIEAAKQAVASAEKPGGDDLLLASALIRLGDGYRSRFVNTAQADMAYQHALSIYQKTLQPDDSRIADLLMRLSRVGLTENVAAEQLIQRALAIYSKQASPDENALLRARFDLAGNLVGQRRYKEAEPLLIEAIQHYEKAPTAEFAFALRYYATVLEFTGRLAEARDMPRRFDDALNQTTRR